MKKLQPVLKQIFWIATAFVALLAFGGWWMAIGDLNKQIVTDKATLEKKLAEAEAELAEERRKNREALAAQGRDNEEFK